MTAQYSCDPHIKRDRIEDRIMDEESLRNRLHLADETIGILRSSNTQLDRNFNGLKSDFSVLESLMIESGQTLQRLQEMVRHLLVQFRKSNNCKLSDISRSLLNEIHNAFSFMKTLTSNSPCDFFYGIFLFR